jgi:hypothetical protein
VKGDSARSTVKVILGWVIYTTANTISLPVHRLARIREILASIGATKRRESLKKWQQVLGELRYMALAIPAAIDLFSVLQEALKFSDGHRVRLTRHIHDFLHDFRWLVDDVGARPTAIDELVPDHPPPLPMAPATLRRKVWAVYTLSPSLVANCYLSYEGRLGPLPLSRSLFTQTTRPAQSPTATWNWPPPLHK